MIESSTSGQLPLLRIVAALAIVLFSYQMISTFTLSEEQEMEIVDIDLDDDSEEEIDEVDLINSSTFFPAELYLPTASFVPVEQKSRLHAQARSELHSPPPERIFIFPLA